MGTTGACCCHIRIGCQGSDGVHGCLILTGSPSRHTQEVFVSPRLKAWCNFLCLLTRESKGSANRKSLSVSGT